MKYEEKRSSGPTMQLDYAYIVLYYGVEIGNNGLWISLRFQGGWGELVELAIWAMWFQDLWGKVCDWTLLHLLCVTAQQHSWSQMLGHRDAAWTIRIWVAWNVEIQRWQMCQGRPWVWFTPGPHRINLFLFSGETLECPILLSFSDMVYSRGMTFLPVLALDVLRFSGLSDIAWNLNAVFARVNQHKYQGRLWRMFHRTLMVDLTRRKFGD